MVSYAAAKPSSSRWLQDVTEATEPPLADATDNFVTFGGDDYYDDAMEEDDYYLLPMWATMILVLVGASIVVGLVFYCSYKHERCLFKKNFPKDAEEADIEQGKKLATKSFQDSKAFERLPEQVVKEHMEEDVPSSVRTTDSAKNSSTRTANTADSMIHSMIAAPRCVLCSKPFEMGENVTHSSACHHEYHEACLLKHWGKMEKSKKTKDQSGKCPVCKVVYVVEEIGPSAHFSSQMNVMEDSSKRASDVVQPFEIVEEELAEDNCCGNNKQ